MKLVRVKTLGLFGLGFLAGSRAGRGPWEKAQAGMDQIKGKVAGGSGANDRHSQTTPQVTEI